MSSQKKMLLGSSLVTNVASDVQYELNRCFLANVKDQLIHKQIAVMMESNLLIDTLMQRNNKREMEVMDKDMCNFATSNTLDTLLTQQDEMPKPRRLLTRKNAQNNTRTLVVDSNINTALDEVRQNCSQRTFLAISKLYESYSKVNKNKEVKNQQSVQGVNRSGIIRMRPETERNNGDQAVILTARNIKLEKQNHVLNDKIKQLQAKIEYLSTYQAKQDSLKSYITFHQKNIQINIQKAEHFHNSIIQALQKTFIQAGCNRCCSLIKKIKDSLINYRVNLQQQIQNYHKLCEDIKKINHVQFMATTKKLII